ncbi:MAG: DUF1015 domain-containing protein [bacterium]|nr:DUF1015 domain-containing protein [bacterium]
MSEIRPFRGLRFARDAQPRLAGPYDVIYADERAQLGAEPENIVHLTLPPGEMGARDYAAARTCLEDWIGRGVLVRDDEPALYVLEERVTDGRVRRGFVSTVRLADYDERVILPHERTMKGPKMDRLLLTRAAQANLEPTFFLYEDREDKLAQALDTSSMGAPLVDCRGPDGTHLKLFALSDVARVETVQGFLKDRSLIIADGHHRYETMLRYRDECREAIREAGGEPDPEDPHEFVMAYVVNAFDPGSRIQAIHRVLKAEVNDPRAVLEAVGFKIGELDTSVSGSDIVEQLAKHREQFHAFVLASGDAPPLLATRSRGQTLDVQVLHEELLPELGGELSFDSKPERLLENVRAGSVSLGLFLNPTGADELFRVVRDGTVLPQKSTFFSPKIPSGLIVRDF